jgi:hypothetical protein
MFVTLFALGTAIIAVAAVAGGAASHALDHHCDDVGGDFGASAGRDAELRALIAGARR